VSEREKKHRGDKKRRNELTENGKGGFFEKQTLGQELGKEKGQRTRGGAKKKRV